METMSAQSGRGRPNVVVPADGSSPLPWLARCVGDPVPFLSASWSKEPLLRRGCAGDYANIFSIEALLGLMEAENLASDRMKMVNRGIVAPPEKYLRLRRTATGSERTVADRECVRQLIGNGFTLIIRDAQEDVVELSHLCAGLQAELRRRVGANVYYTPAMSRGFRAHTDGHDVIILQLHSEKYWRVFDRRDDESLEPRNVDLSTEQLPAIETRLQDGDSLYIPRRFVHCAAAASRPSMHVTIGIHR